MGTGGTQTLSLASGAPGTSLFTAGLQGEQSVLVITTFKNFGVSRLAQDSLKGHKQGLIFARLTFPFLNIKHRCFVLVPSLIQPNYSTNCLAYMCMYM